MITKVDRNYLEIKSLKDLKSSKIPSSNCFLTIIDPPDFQLNKFFYKQIGKDFRWTDRLVWNDQKWIDYVLNSRVNTYVLKEKDDLIGYFEQINHHEDQNCEVAYLGILKEFYGKGYGGYLLTEAINKSLKKNIKKVWLHTCTLDHKNAIKNYIARGMKIYKSETIQMDVNQYNSDN